MRNRPLLRTSPPYAKLRAGDDTLAVPKRGVARGQSPSIQKKGASEEEPSALRFSHRFNLLPWNSRFRQQRRIQSLLQGFLI